MLSENRLGVDDEGSRDMGYKENEEEPPPEGMHRVCSLVSAIKWFFRDGAKKQREGAPFLEELNSRYWCLFRIHSFLCTFLFSLVLIRFVVASSFLSFSFVGMFFFNCLQEFRHRIMQQNIFAAALSTLENIFGV